eukprot:m.307229 g.307229  ORF g.307229 m.307229 type:complete len:72 (+) comp42036_c0_seq1:2833-3048(+)
MGDNGRFCLFFLCLFVCFSRVLCQNRASFLCLCLFVSRWLKLLIIMAKVWDMKIEDVKAQPEIEQILFIFY